MNKSVIFILFFVTFSNYQAESKCKDGNRLCPIKTGSVHNSTQCYNFADFSTTDEYQCFNRMDLNDSQFVSNMTISNEMYYPEEFLSVELTYTKTHVRCNSDEAGIDLPLCMYLTVW